MIKYLSLVFLILFNSADLMSNVRKDFHTLKTEKQVVQFIEKYKNSSSEKTKAYLAVAIMRKAEFTYFPNKKLAYFNKGKEILESYIKKHKNCLEARYLRILVQSKVPFILDYSSDITKDKKIIRRNIAQANLPKDYKRLIIKNIKSIK